MMQPIESTNSIMESTWGFLLLLIVNNKDNNNILIFICIIYDPKINFIQFRKSIDIFNIDQVYKIPSNVWWLIIRNEF